MIRGTGTTRSRRWRAGSFPGHAPENIHAYGGSICNLRGKAMPLTAAQRAAFRRVTRGR